LMYSLLQQRAILSDWPVVIIISVIIMVVWRSGNISEVALC